MSVYVQIFIQSELPTQDVADAVAKLLQTTFKRTEGNEVEYITTFENLNVVLFEAGAFENDRDLDFENYTHYIDMWFFGSGTRDCHNEKLAIAGYKMFEVLRKRTIFNLMLVFDMQCLLEKYQRE